MISQAVDDRTSAERGENESDAVGDPRMVGAGIRRLAKSRYSSVSLFIAKPRSQDDLDALASLNDVPADMDEDAYRLLRDGGLDPPLAAHIAHLFVRDPLVIFNDSIFLDNDKSLVRPLENESSRGHGFIAVAAGPLREHPVDELEIHAVEAAFSEDRIRVCQAQAAG